VSFGVQLKNESGDIYFDSDTIAWNYMGSFIAPADTTEATSMPTISLVNETLVQRFFVDEAPGDQEAYLHSVTISGTTVTANSGTAVGKVRTLVIVLGR
jgi:hypothetical protein